MLCATERQGVFILIGKWENARISLKHIERTQF